jgi:YgiT-type zinc finger domain-containing protein
MEPGLQEAQVMICLICRQAEIVDRLTAVNFQRGKMQMLVEHVPARVCPNCGEAYLGEEVTLQLLQSMEKMYRTGTPESRIEYNSLP